MSVTIRLETPQDHRAVEHLTREAFWNLHMPGCNEHLLAHKLRTCAAFEPRLDFVAEQDGRVIGNIMYSKSRVARTGQPDFETLTFGPLSVLPAFHGRGVGAALVRHSLAEAAALGHKAVIIFGDPHYYHRFGFASAESFGIATRDGANFDPFMALELQPGALAGIQGRFYDDPFFVLDAAEVEAFDKHFPKKEKGPARVPLG
ncbi:MAG: N-acetyltransferase [Ruminococcaceae bacterium]|nr:N-acetyltransferase [Oscillospiraceae bacterium]